MSDRPTFLRRSEPKQVDDCLDCLANVVDFAYEHGYHEHGVPLVEIVREHVAALRVHVAALGALIPYARHTEREYRGQNADSRDWVDGCHKLPWVNRFGQVYGSALPPKPCDCGLDEALAAVASAEDAGNGG